MSNITRKNYRRNGLNPNAEEWKPSRPNSHNKPLPTSYEMRNVRLNVKYPIIDAVAIDCEMVGVGRYGRESALAHVAIVDFEGNEIYNKYVIPRGGINSITNYRTRYSGITKNILNRLSKEEHAFNTIKDEVHSILQNRIIVGHGLINDFKVLDYDPDANHNIVWDTTVIPKYQRRNNYTKTYRAKKLKNLSLEFTGNKIQNYKNIKGDGHSPLEDARASMNLFRMEHHHPKIKYNNMSK